LVRGLVIGAVGQVGSALRRALDAANVETIGTCHTHGTPGLLPLELTDDAAVRALIADVRPDVIFLTAALTAVDYCEDHEAEARRINVDGPRSVARAARAAGSKLVFYSTEYVFDGTAGPYGEDDPVAPQGVYARSKADGECAIREELDDHLIIRTTVVFSWDRTSLNFAMQVWKRLSAGGRMPVPSDQIGNPTLADFLAKVSVELAQRKVGGETVNVVGRDRVPRTEFAVRLAQRLALDAGLIEPVTTAELHKIATAERRPIAPRPLSAGLKTDKLTQLLGRPAMTLDEALDRFAAQQRADSVP
jgi:dTDP-4-dehydrorhamnose reductase